MSAAARCSAIRVVASCSGVTLGILGPLAAVGGHHVVDARAGGGEVRDGGAGAELAVVGMADDDERALERADQLMAVEGAHRRCYR